MKLFKILILLVLILVIGGFAVLAFTDTPVAQKTVVKEIPHERLSEDP